MVQERVGWYRRGWDGTGDSRMIHDASGMVQEGWLVKEIVGWCSRGMDGPEGGGIVHERVGWYRRE